MRLIEAPDAMPDPGPGFWATVGRRIAAAASCVGGAAATAARSVDADVYSELATLPLMALSSLGPRRATVREKPDDGHRPVVFVHGLGGHRGNFHAMATWFRANGRRRVYSVGLRGSRSAWEHADQLSDFVEDVLDVNGIAGRGQVDVVGHSRGGVVARLALDDVQTRRRVARLVTIGSPHAGTESARYGRGRQLDELRPGSPVIARLRRQLPWTGPPLTCLWSPADVLVVPGANARVPGADNIEMPLGHCRMVLWPSAWRTVFEALR